MPKFNSKVNRGFIQLCSFALLSLALIASTGCYQRTVAPELTYDQSQVDVLDKEIKKLDWEM